MRRYDITVRFFWLALGLFVVIYSYTLGLGKLIDPGPGLLPFLLGLIFLVLSTVRLCMVLRLKEQNEEHTQVKTHYLKLVIVVVVLFFWALVLEPLGFLIATFILMTLLYRIAGYTKWYIAIVWGLITVFTTYFIFTYLGVRFPPGILRTLGIG